MPKKINFLPTFVKKLQKYHRKNPRLIEKYNRKVKLFLQDPHNVSLKTHKLSGDLDGYYAFSIEEDVHVVFEWQGEKVTFIKIGSHDEVY